MIREFILFGSMIAVFSVGLRNLRIRPELKNPDQQIVIKESAYFLEIVSVPEAVKQEKKVAGQTIR